MTLAAKLRAHADNADEAARASSLAGDACRAYASREVSRAFRIAAAMVEVEPTRRPTCSIDGECPGCNDWASRRIGVLSRALAVAETSAAAAHHRAAGLDTRLSVALRERDRALALVPLPAATLPPRGAVPDVCEGALPHSAACMCNDCITSGLP